MPVTITAGPPPAKSSKASTVTGKPASPAMSRKTKERSEGLQGIGQLMTAGLLFARQHADAGAVHKFWPGISDEAAKLGEDNPKVGEFLDSLTVIGPFAGLITAVLPLAFQVMVNHNKIDVTAVANLGCVSKETLQAQVQAEIMAAEMQALQEQMELESERAEVLREYQRMQEETRASREADNSADAMRMTAHP